MPKFLKPAPAQGGRPAGSRTFRRDWAVEYYGMRSPRSAPRKSAPFVQICHRQTKPAAAARRAPQLIPRPLPTLEPRLGVYINGVRSARYGQRHRTGASSGADFGFWRPSAREKCRRLGRFRGRGRFRCTSSTQRTIFVVCIHPRASPAIGQICRFYACRSMSRASRKRT